MQAPGTVDQLMTRTGTEPVYDFSKARARKLAAALKRQETPAEAEQAREDAEVLMFDAQRQSHDQ